MANLKKKALGRGLSALIPSKSAEEEAPQAKAFAVAEPPAPGEQLLYLDPKAIAPNPQQPRTVFNEEALQELAESVRRYGLQEPIIVRKKGADPNATEYELVSGERRVRASVMADIERIPAVCREVSDGDLLKLGLIENIQREDLNAIELARAYEMLLGEFGWTQEELAEQVGKKRVTVTNTLRLLHLPADVQQAVAEGALSMGHARALLALESPQAMSAACRKVIEQGLSVRQVEKLTSPKARAPRKTDETDANQAAVEEDLRRALGTRVRLHLASKGRGKIEIEFYTLDDLERILHVVTRSTH